MNWLLKQWRGRINRKWNIFKMKQDMSIKIFLIGIFLSELMTITTVMKMISNKWIAFQINLSQKNKNLKILKKNKFQRNKFLKKCKRGKKHHQEYPQTSRKLKIPKARNKSQIKQKVFPRKVERTQRKMRINQNYLQLRSEIWERENDWFIIFSICDLFYSWNSL